MKMNVENGYGTHLYLYLWWLRKSLGDAMKRPGCCFEHVIIATLLFYVDYLRTYVEYSKESKVLGYKQDFSDTASWW